MLLGIDENEVWEEKSLELPQQGRLAISTDGITETFGDNDEMFSKERLLSTLLECRTRSLAETNENARHIVDAHRGDGEQTDDVTLLLLEFVSSERLGNSISTDSKTGVERVYQRPLVS